MTTRMRSSSPKAQKAVPRPALSAKRLGPLAVIALLVVIALALGPQNLVSFDEIARRHATLAAMAAAHPALTALAAIGFYALVTLISFPGAWLVTVAYGLILGWLAGTLYVVSGATLGAAILYLITRFALTDFFAARSGPVLNRMAKGFREDATAYLLFLRLAPVFPFTLVNVVPAILGVPFVTFLWTTAVGIVPGTFAFAFAGEGLRSIVDERARACALGVPPCGTPLDPAQLVTTDIVIAFVVLALASLLPVVLKWWRREAA